MSQPGLSTSSREKSKAERVYLNRERHAGGVGGTLTLLRRFGPDHVRSESRASVVVVAGMWREVSGGAALDQGTKSVVVTGHPSRSSHRFTDDHWMLRETFVVGRVLSRLVGADRCRVLPLI